MHRLPSHIVLPAIHVRREEGEIFRTGTRHGAGRQRDPTYLTHEARKHLRCVPTADVAMTGVNFRRGLRGCRSLRHQRGNADLGRRFRSAYRDQRPAARPITVRWRSSPRLLARSATWAARDGLYVAVPTSGSRASRFHVVIVDNEWHRIAAHNEARKTATCLKCLLRRLHEYLSCSPAVGRLLHRISSPARWNQLGTLRSPERHAGNVGLPAVLPCSNVVRRGSTWANRYACAGDGCRDGVADTRKKLAVEGMDVVMRHKTCSTRV